MLVSWWQRSRFFWIIKKLIKQEKEAKGRNNYLWQLPIAKQAWKTAEKVKSLPLQTKRISIKGAHPLPVFLHFIGAPNLSNGSDHDQGPVKLNKGRINCIYY